MNAKDMALELEKSRAQVDALCRGLHWLAQRMADTKMRPVIEDDFICSQISRDECLARNCAECWAVASLYSTMNEADGLWMFLPARRARPRKARKA